uniref:Uncharacterized protein n=1 Tax=Fagus sylvatica TaxID=28930 RepID=A0A2N9GCD1_FAGSY
MATKIFKTNDLVFLDRPSFAFSDRLPYGNYGFFIARLMMSMRCSEVHDEAERIKQLMKESNELGAKVVLGDVLGPLRILAFWLYGRKAIDDHEV